MKYVIEVGTFLSNYLLKMQQGDLSKTIKKLWNNWIPKIKRIGLKISQCPKKNSESSAESLENCFSKPH